MDIDGLAAATLRFTENSNATPNAIAGTSDMAGFVGKALGTINGNRYLLTWLGKEGQYYCVFESNPPIQGNTAKGLGAALQKSASSQPEDLNKGCSATQIVAGSSSTVTAPTTVQTDTPIPVPAAQALPQKLELGQMWRVSISNSDIFTFKILKAASSVPSSLGSSAGWFEARVDKVQRVSAFGLSPDEIQGFIKLNNGALQVYGLTGNRGFACEFTAAMARGNRFVGGVYQPASGTSTCAAQWAGTLTASGVTLPTDATAVLENAKRNSGTANAWAGLKNVAYRSESNTGGVVRQTITILDFAGMRLYREFLQGTGAQQVIMAKEWQILAGNGKAKGTYRLEAGGNGLQFVSVETKELDAALYTDFWALRFGGLGWENATLENMADGSQMLIVARQGLYTRFVIRNGKYAGVVLPSPLSAVQLLTIIPEKLADAGGILAPLGAWNVTASVGQFDSGLIEKLLKVVMNFEIPAGLFDLK